MRVILDRKDIEAAIAAEMLRKFPGYTIKLEALYNISGEIEVHLSEVRPIEDWAGTTGGGTK